MESLHTKKSKGKKFQLSTSCGVLCLPSRDTGGLRPGEKQDIEEPVETEGERQLKALLKKQLDTNVSFHQCNKRAREFTEGSIYEDVTKDVQGEQSLPQYKQLALQHNERQRLAECGLGKYQIQLLSSKESDSLSQKKRKYNPAVKDELQEHVKQQAAVKQTLLEGSQSQTFAGARAMSRHERDLERSLCVTAEQKKLTACLTKHGTLHSTDDPSDPANQLQDILDGIGVCVYETDNTDSINASGGEEGVVATCAARPADWKIVTKCNDCEGAGIQNVSGNPHHKQSVDVEINSLDKCDNCGKISKQEEIPPEEMYTRLKKIEPIAEELIKQNSLTLEEIHKIPRFENYSAGEPSKVLYLKNLSPRATVEDLAGLFNRYQQEGTSSIEFKLLKKRMKGQAFITLPDVEVATAALDLIGGYQLKGKPIIIHYGKRKET